MTDHPAQPPADVERRACAACGITGQPLTVTRFRGIGEAQWQELWRCEDISGCHDRVFPWLARLLGELAGAAGPPAGSDPAARWPQGNTL